MCLWFVTEELYSHESWDIDPILSMFSLKGKTKRRFVNLQLFTVMYGKDLYLLIWFFNKYYITIITYYKLHV